MKEITRDWLISAESDLKIIEKAVDDNSLTHQVAFHAQQAIEKSLKAIIEEHELGFMRTHSLETLVAKTINYIKLPVDLTVIKKLDQLYIDARYPGDLGLLPNGKPDLSEALIFQKIAKDICSSVSDYLNEL